MFTCCVGATRQNKQNNQWFCRFYFIIKQRRCHFKYLTILKSWLLDEEGDKSCETWALSSSQIPATALTWYGARKCCCSETLISMCLTHFRCWKLIPFFLRLFSNYTQTSWYSTPNWVTKASYLECRSTKLAPQLKSSHTTTLPFCWLFHYRKREALTQVYYLCPVNWYREEITVLDWLDPLVFRLYFMLTEICWQLQVQQPPNFSFLITASRKPSISKSVSWVLFVSAYLLPPFF